jgi:hypothetical protein
LSIKSDIVLLMSNVEERWLLWPVLFVLLNVAWAYVLGGECIVGLIFFGNGWFSFTLKL